ncbi:MULTISPECIES: hypothetical protein [unclassified Streptomyces]|uniref:hypothetical protein n=1 Tax=unclassified Streptomyces TaxID=2593676 RepID=UPI0016608093|nr:MULTISPECIES: hypothetical protein [unclassified Streptomyces]MBD0710263.1 hypothetical protein [Streptomyces sp. CBMA291]MBD0712870.1 hypothetical protein [Streptomyces sp. CBMA370]
MTGSHSDAVLPPGFLLTAMSGRDSDDPVVRLAVQRLRSTASGPDRSDRADWSDRSALGEGLLSGPLAEEAPDWLLEAAVAADLAAEGEEHLHGRDLRLAALALGHPSCTAELRERVVGQCTPGQLARLAGPRADERLAAAVADAVRAFGSTPMVPRLLEEPTPAQVVLGQWPLHDLVFEAARDTLPTFPEPEDGGREESWKNYRQAHKAWQTLWGQVLGRHTDRHRSVVEWAEGTEAERVVRDQLLGELPWAVDTGLLTELALADLGRFDFRILLAKGARMRRDGAEKERIYEHLAAELSSLTAEDRGWFESDMDARSGTALAFGCRAPVDWIRHSASTTWRHLLNPDQAVDGNRQVHWKAPAETLAGLATRFAETAVRALPYWEPAGRYATTGPDEVAWVRDMLLHLPTVTEDIKAAVRPIVKQARLELAGSRHDFSSGWEKRRQTEEILATVQRVLADPPPATGADRRRAALGAPGELTVRTLSAVSARHLGEYLDRHAGDDSLVEKALLSSAASSPRSDRDFEDVLRRHRTPCEALLRLTTDLRRHLGGGPSWRETWTRLVLARPETGTELVRALPAWSALRARGGGYGTAHPMVVSVVREALGADPAAWERFADCPATHSGPTAWLRLGDLLDAAAEGTAWPKPSVGR